MRKRVNLTKKLNLVGKKFGRLLVLCETAYRYDRSIIWRCMCDCGTFKDVPSRSLQSGNTRSCGCYKIAKSFTHGLSKTAEYISWYHMLQRCNNTNNDRYKDYGGRGSRVCIRWSEFENFISDMGYKPEKEYSLDRIDVNGNYEPSNCKWSTKKEQANNQRRINIANELSPE